MKNKTIASLNIMNYKWKERLLHDGKCKYLKEMQPQANNKQNLYI